MKSRPSGIEALTVRRATVADMDKVRYRVYRSPTDFIAVIAESALMAVKVAGISKPHKIVRDLPTEGVAIEAKKMAKLDDKAERIIWPVKPSAPPSRIVAELAPAGNEDDASALFKPMTIGDLQRKSEVRARILSPEMLSEIIGAHTKPVPAPAAPVAADPVVQPEPVAAAPAPEPELSPQERILQLAQEALPETPPAVPATDHNLSPEEVEKLLNG